MTSPGSAIFCSDVNGNMTQRNESSDTYTFPYDLENRLTSGTKNGVMLATYIYDGNGVRVKAVENGVTTIYIGDYYEWRSDLTTTTEVKYYSAAGQRIAMRTNGVLTWLLGDHLGSTTITANADGTLASGQTYTAWGTTRGGSLPTDRQYTSQISEPQLGIYFYNARYYDPYLARFIQADTIIPQPGNPLAWDRYIYVRNNPVNYSDPTGHYEACEENCDEQKRLSMLYDSLGAVDYFKHEIKGQFGIEMEDGNVKWAIDNLMTAYHALSMINQVLNGNLKSMLGGTSFVITDGGNQYYGWTYSDKVEYHVINGNYNIPLTNFLHEAGHLLDMVSATDGVFSKPLEDTTPDWVDSQGYVDGTLLLGKLYQPVQAKYISGEDFNTNEYWADAFANFVADNIDLSEPTGAGQKMYDYVYGALRPYANP